MGDISLSMNNEIFLFSFISHFLKKKIICQIRPYFKRDAEIYVTVSVNIKPLIFKISLPFLFPISIELKFLNLKT